MARHVLSPAERGWLDRIEGGCRTLVFYRCWTRKEAVLKATGDGLRVPMPTLTVSGPGEPPRLIASSRRAGLAGRTALCDLRPGTGYVGAVAVLAGGPVAVRELEEVALSEP
jgi:4'-phosphopantetheinyl transferase